MQNCMDNIKYKKKKTFYTVIQTNEVPHPVQLVQRRHSLKFAKPAAPSAAPDVVDPNRAAICAKYIDAFAYTAPPNAACQSAMENIHSDSFVRKISTRLEGDIFDTFPLIFFSYGFGWGFLVILENYREAVS